MKPIIAILVLALAGCATKREDKSPVPTWSQAQWPSRSTAWRWNERANDRMLCKLPTLESESGEIIRPFSE